MESGELFQDTNGLAFNTLSAVLGVSKEMDLLVNSVIEKYKINILRN